MALKLIAHASPDAKADVYCIGLQEIVSLNAMNVLAIGGSTEKRAKQALNVLQTALTALHGVEYVAVEQPTCLVGIAQFVLVRPNLPIAKPLRATAACGEIVLGKTLANKGAAALRFQIGPATLCVCTVHLPAGEGREASAKRDEAFAEVMTALGGKYARSGVMPPLQHDLCVVMGDFNSRVEVSRAAADRLLFDKHAAERLGGAKAAMQALLKEDQLLKDADGIKPFSEAPIDFPPSYKFDVGTSTYDSSAKQRTPSWTDRVLWHGARVTATRYTSCAELVASDHKPVVATLSWLDGWLEVDQAAEK